MPMKKGRNDTTVEMKPEAKGEKKSEEAKGERVAKFLIKRRKTKTTTDSNLTEDDDDKKKAV
jgi:hypothetical protein